jgi:alpha-galactosidase
MGWNSWDAYGLAITEGQYRDNAQVLATLKDYGWNYAVIDEGWFLQNPETDKPETFVYTLDANGRNIPAPNRFPSAANGAGFKPLADWTHAQGLKFGIHILRGIPKLAVKGNLPIAGSSFHAADAADTTETCPWNPDNYGVTDSPAGQAWYDSLFALYAAWGIDFVKVDCIADHPYRAAEIRMIASAIHKTGRTIALSLSPGPTQLEHAAEIAQHAQMWRIADDIWDGWEFPGQQWPNGLLSAFDNLAKWAPYNKPGNYPDADMLPWGYLGPNPGWGKPRQSRLTQAEQRTQFTLWAIARTPLILGANLTKLDDFTKSLITNRDVIRIHQRAWASQQLKTPPSLPSTIRVWEADEEAFANPPIYLALFNLENKPATIQAPLKDFGGPIPHHAILHNLYDGSRSPATDQLSITLAPHGSALFRLE